MRVEARQLQQWYRTLDQLFERKAQIEHALFLRLRTCSRCRSNGVLRFDLDLFRGQGTAGDRANGHSRDGKPRNPQVLVGLVMVDGWPIAHHVFEGNRRDAKTVPEVLRDLEQRFGLKRIVFVGDRGMVTSQNLDELRCSGHGYIVGRNRRRSGEVFDYIQRATGPWIECPVGITAREKSTAPKTLVQEVAANQPGVRVFIVHSEERLAYERNTARKRWTVSAQNSKSWRSASPGAAQGGREDRRRRRPYPGSQSWSPLLRLVLQGRRLSFLRASRPLHARASLRRQIRHPDRGAQSSAVEAVRLYKELSEVERAFANLKDVLDMRPIYHRTDHRVQAHIFVAALAFLLHRAIEKKLKAAGLDLSATEALTALKSVRVVDIDLGDGTSKRSVTRGTQRAASVLRALGITDLDPPTPPQPGQTVM